MDSVNIFPSKIITTLSLLLFFLSEFGIAQTGESMKATAVVKKSEIKKIAMDAGIHDYALKMTNGKKWDVRILIPIMGKEQKYPLVLALHWAGDQEAYRTYSECLVFPAFQNINTFIVVPTSDGSHWIDPKTETRVIDLLRKLKIRFPIAKDQIVVTGYSNGGMGSWKYAEAYPNLFSAAIPMAGYYEKKKIRIPVYTIHGEKDELFKVSIVQNAMAQSKKMGSPIDLSIVKGLSHYMACSYTDVLHEKALHLQETIFKNVEHQ